MTLSTCSSPGTMTDKTYPRFTWLHCCD